MVIYSNPSHESLGKYFTKIVRVMRKIGFITSPDSTTVAIEKFGATIYQMSRELPIICSLVSNGLLVSIDIKYSFISSQHRHQGPIHDNSLVSPKSTFMVMFNITNNVVK